MVVHDVTNFLGWVWTTVNSLPSGAMKQMGAVSEPGQEEATAPAAEEREEKGLMDKAKEKLMGQ